jgi:hypothetical protein
MFSESMVAIDSNVPASMGGDGRAILSRKGANHESGLHDTETRMIQTLLDEIEREEKLAPQSMAHIKHFLSGIYRYAIRQGYVPAGTTNQVTSTETASVPDFDGRAYTLEEIAVMFAVLPEPSRNRDVDLQLLLASGL